MKCRVVATAADCSDCCAVRGFRLELSLSSLTSSVWDFFSFGNGKDFCFCICAVAAAVVLVVVFVDLC